MLTREAFNALLKTLEEPPAHCIFILATTEAHKLPETIVSRTQRFEFKAVNRQQAAEHLQTIAKHENIDIEPAALDLLAEFGGGSFRDSISYLDQLSSYSKKITTDEVRALLGLPAAAEIKQLADKLDQADMPGTLEVLNNLQGQGIRPGAISAGLSELIRAQAGSGSAQPWQIALLKELLDVAGSHRPQESLEVSLLSSITDRSDVKSVQPDIAPQAPKKNIVKEQPVSKPEITTEKVSESEAKAPPALHTSFDLSLWNEVINRSKKEAASIYTALRLAHPDYNDGVLTLNFQFPLHQKKLDLAKNKDLVAHIIQEVCGQHVKIKTELNKPASPSPLVDPAEVPSVSSISNIFGGAEVLET